MANSDLSQSLVDLSDVATKAALATKHKNMLEGQL